jgi:hypothetical protein
MLCSMDGCEPKLVLTTLLNGSCIWSLMEVLHRYSIIFCHTYVDLIKEHVGTA